MVERVKVSVATGRGVAERWRQSYQRDGAWTRVVGGSSEVIYNRLCDLGENPDVDAVATAIGNKSWSYLTCNACGEEVKRAADLSRAYSDGPNLICRPCLEDAIKAMDRA